MVDLKYFTHKELACPSTEVVRLSPSFGEQLDKLRDDFGLPININSCCRSEDHNKSIGGHPRSLHVYDKPAHPTNGCMAIDIDITPYTDEQWLKLVNLAWNSEWSVGIAKTFLHLDRRVDIGLNKQLYRY